MPGALPHAVGQFAELLSRETGQSLSEGRSWRIETLLRPLMRDHGFASLDELFHAIERDLEGALKAAAIDAMLNHESSFFRDMPVFKAIEYRVIPHLIERATQTLLRIWCVGCSTGQEAYSLAMLTKRMPILKGWHIDIQATDVSALAVDKARRGFYAQVDMQRGLPINELLRWFEPVGDEWRLLDELRTSVTFRTDNLLDPREDFGQFDLILCRNVLLYFPEHHRRKACEKMAQRAQPGAFLVLGAGELLSNQTEFSASGETSCIYTLCDQASCDRDRAESNSTHDLNPALPHAALPRDRALR